MIAQGSNPFEAAVHNHEAVNKLHDKLLAAAAIHNVYYPKRDNCSDNKCGKRYQRCFERIKAREPTVMGTIIYR